MDQQLVVTSGTQLLKFHFDAQLTLSMQTQRVRSLLSLAGLPPSISILSLLVSQERCRSKSFGMFLYYQPRLGKEFGAIAKFNCRKKPHQKNSIILLTNTQMSYANKTLYKFFPSTQQMSPFLYRPHTSDSCYSICLKMIFFILCKTAVKYIFEFKCQNDGYKY